jgi:hypothetical protein
VEGIALGESALLSELESSDTLSTLFRGRKMSLAQIQRCLGNPARYNLTLEEKSSLEMFCARITLALDAA